MPLWAEFFSKLWFPLLAGSRGKLEVRLAEFIKGKYMYMKTKNQAQVVTSTDVGGPGKNLWDITWCCFTPGY